MTTHQIQRLIAVQEWYKQSGAAKHFYISYPLKACYQFRLHGRKVPVSYQGVTWFSKEHYWQAYFPRTVMQRVAGYYVQKYQRDPQFARTHRKYWEQHYAKPLRALVHKIRAENLSALSMSAFVALFRKFSLTYTDCWYEVIFLDSFDVEGQEWLRSVAKRSGDTVNDGSLQLLTTAREFSVLQKEMKQRLQLTEQCSRKASLVALVKNGMSWNVLGKRFPDLGRAIQDHARQWCWIENDYDVIHDQPASWFWESIRGWLVDAQSWQKERERLSALKIALKEKKQLIRAQHVSQELVHAGEFIESLSRLRDERKAHQQIGSPVAQMLVHEWARRLGVRVSDIERLSWEELLEYYQQPRVLQKRSFERQDGMFTFSSDLHSPDILYGKRAHVVNDLFDQKIALQNGAVLRGTPASKGVAIGVVKLILTKADFSKMKPGDILVAPNTRPEYVPMMKMAKAIVTEEGGVTSHAAIVSRELGITAVVGVQGAIAALHDGDRIEVNANTGEVRKL